MDLYRLSIKKIESKLIKQFLRKFEIPPKEHYKCIHYILKSF